MRVIPLSKQRDSDIPEYKRKFSGRWSANIIVKKLPAATCTIWKRSKNIVRRSTASECVNWVATLCICVIGYIYTCLVYHLRPKKVNVCQNLSKIFRSQMSFTAQTLERVFVIIRQVVIWRTECMGRVFMMKTERSPSHIVWVLPFRCSSCPKSSVSEALSLADAVRTFRRTSERITLTYSFYPRQSIVNIFDSPSVKYWRWTRPVRVPQACFLYVHRSRSDDIQMMSPWVLDDVPCCPRPERFKAAVGLHGALRTRC